MPDPQTAWYEDAKHQTQETLPGFIERVMGYSHDYNTACHAVAACALAAGYVAASRQGITGFQSVAVMWEFISDWKGGSRRPMRLIDYQDLLYPQYAYKFQPTIAQDTADWMKAEAEKLVNERPMAVSAVEDHWSALAGGKIPFGLTVSNA